MPKRVQIENTKTGESYDVPLTVFHKEWEPKGFRIAANEDGTAYEEPKARALHDNGDDAPPKAKAPEDK